MTGVQQERKVTCRAGAGEEEGHCRQQAREQKEGV